MTEDEERAARYLREILREDTTVAETLLGFPWLANGVTEHESWAIQHLRFVLREDPAVAKTLLSFPWLADGVTKDERNAAYYLRGILREDTAVAETLLGFPWLANGVTKYEERALYYLRDILREDPAVAETLLGFPWLADDVTEDERYAADYLRDILRGDPAKAKTLLSSPWLADGVTWAESQTLWRLRGLYAIERSSLSTLNTKPWYKDGLSNEEIMVVGYLGAIAEQSQADAQAILGMPFLESVESRDTLALESLSEIAEQDAIGFRELMSHPRIKDGITDEETKIVAVLGGSTIHHGAPGSAQVLLADSGVYIEERLIELPHTGETLLAVIRTEDKVTHSMDYLEHAVRTIEEFMGVPYPIDYLALLFYDRKPGASNTFTHLLMMPELDVADGPQWYAGVIAHEAGHWHWRNEGSGFQYQHWIVEGSANFLRIISNHERLGQPHRTIGEPPCPYFDNISAVEKASPTPKINGQSNPLSNCYDTLGQHFFLNLYLALGDETFRPAYRNLYLRHKQDDPPDGCGGPRLSICRVEAAFKDGASDEVVRLVDEIIDRWYYGTPVLNPSSLTCSQLTGDNWLNGVLWKNVNGATVATALNCGADIDAKDDKGRTPLHYAARYNENPAVIQALLDASPDINAKDRGGKTSLHLAARYSDNPVAIQTLLDAGADINARDNSGRTPLALAKERENDVAIKVLEGAGAW